MSDPKYKQCVVFSLYTFLLVGGGWSFNRWDCGELPNAIPWCPIGGWHYVQSCNRWYPRGLEGFGGTLYDNNYMYIFWICMKTIPCIHISIWWPRPRHVELVATGSKFIGVFELFSWVHSPWRVFLLGVDEGQDYGQPNVFAVMVQKRFGIDL